MLLALLEADDRNPAMPSLNCCGYGAFNLPPDEITNRAALRGVDTVGLYGMSEVQALYARRDHQLLQDQRYLPGGKLISKEARVRVRNPDTGQLLDYGESGELEFSGPSMMSEYFENLEATADIFTSDGFLKSGDLGYMTSETDFVFETRMGDTLRLGGYLVSPAEIENHLIDHKTVSAAQVVAILIKNKLKPYAFVIANPEAEIDQEELKEHCKKKLAAFKVPVIFHLLESFPTTNSPNGKKIQRARLRELAEERANP
jgi:fatty-acyl-CoA synthase